MGAEPDDRRGRGMDQPETGADAGAGPVRQERVGPVLALVIDAPPVNALGRAVRAGLMAGIRAAEADPDIAAVAILAEGRTFPAGADIAEFGRPPAAPGLGEVCDAIEACGKPVVAGLHGTALGGGFEVALAAHARVARADARVGLPEVNLGILPGAGGTQRLPRLIGAEQALRLMITGRPVAAAEALALGALDRVVEAGLTEATIALAAQMAGRRPLRTRDRTDGMRDPRAYAAAVAAARAAASAAPVPAPARIVDCVEAAMLLPFDMGQEFERAAFGDLVQSDAARALRATFFAERRAGKMPGAQAQAAPLRQVLVLGAGAEGAEAARAALAAGLAVTLADADRPALVAGLEAISARQEAQVAEGRMTAAAREADWARLSPALAAEAPAEGEAPADLVLLTGTFAEPGAALPPCAAAGRVPGAPVASLGRPAQPGPRRLGLVLPPGRRLAELLVGETTAPETIATVLAFARRIDRVAVQARGRGITATLAAALAAASRHLAARLGGASVAKVLAGWNISVEGAAPGEAAGETDEAEVRLRAAMANAGFRLLGEGAALRPSDIDLALVLGLGWPRHVPGPMLWAEERGLILLRAELNRWGAEAPEIWAPAPLVDRMVRDDIKPAALNA